MEKSEIVYGKNAVEALIEKTKDKLIKFLLQKGLNLIQK